MTFSGCPMANVCSFPLCPLSVERTAYPAARPSPIAAYWIDPELPLPPTARKRPFHAVTAGIQTSDLMSESADGLEGTSRRQKGWLIARVNPGCTNPEITNVRASSVYPPILNVAEIPRQPVAGAVTTSREPG